MHTKFAESCREAFRFLVDDFGFDEALVERIGREVFVRYHKGLKTVSVACEWGLAPIVELFFPAGEEDEALFWASKDDVQRARRTPHLATSGVWDQEDGLQYVAYLSRKARELRRLEHGWLEGPG